jgi:hypothetical protein
MTGDALQALLDEREIRRVLDSYSRGVDRLDFDLLRSVFHADATDDHGGYKGLAHELPDYIADATARLNTISTMHSLHNCIIDVDGEVAHAETYFTAVRRRQGEHGPELDWMGGRYVDRLERRDGVWKIAHRLTVHEWDKAEWDIAPHPYGAGWIEGRPAPHDPVYRTAD